MKQNIKRSWLALCMAVCLFALAGCSQAAETEEEIDPSVLMTLQQYLDLFSTMTEEDLQQALDTSAKNKDTVMQSALKSWESTMDDLGALISSETPTVENVDDGYAVRIQAQFEKRNAVFSLIVDEDLSVISSISISPEYTTGEKLSKAGMNTLMGMGIVFLVLIFISWIISMFKYINRFEAGMSKKEAPAAAPAPAAVPMPAAVPAPIAVPVQEEMSDDTELISVIAAAIAASEGKETAEGLVVRSIKRVPKRNWK